MGASWRDSLVRLRDAGWDTDDIDAACEVLAEACLEGDLADLEIHELSPGQVAAVLGVAIDERLAGCLADVAWVRSQGGPEASELVSALYDLDAFADRQGVD